jgi:DNA invertase Pin-like site-specific DNA recombinase
MLIGYARVSKLDQNLELQIDALNKAGCEKIFSDKSSGYKMERQGLTDAFSHLREEDILVVWKLDRLGRSVKGMIDFIRTLKPRPLGVVINIRLCLKNVLKIAVAKP